MANSTGKCLVRACFEFEAVLGVPRSNITTTVSTTDNMGPELEQHTQIT